MAGPEPIQGYSIAELTDGLAKIPNGADAEFCAVGFQLDNQTVRDTLIGNENVQKSLSIPFARKRRHRYAATEMTDGVKRQPFQREKKHMPIQRGYVFE
jgi:hypothetical protein